MSLQLEIDCAVYDSCPPEFSVLPKLTAFQKFIYISSTTLFFSSKLFSFLINNFLLRLASFVVRSVAVSLLFLTPGMLKYTFFSLFLFIDSYHILLQFYTLVQGFFPSHQLPSSLPLPLPEQQPSSFSLDKPISMSQFDRLSVDYTKQELDNLRKFVKSPKCNQFDIILRLKNPKSFARAVEFNEMLDICFDNDDNSDRSVISSSNDSNTEAPLCTPHISST